MRLKRLRLYGFKTFADRTDIDVSGDLIAVVGPNGCGKSNIVDAIAWGLGESNARHLRAQTGSEVIFNGSSQRKPLGFAEVTLVFDNEDGSLGLDASEVAVTRRVNRASESDFQINHRSCRLRDIHDLLADSGLGRGGYAIVGQRDIDAAMSASPEERRAWVDEAAGVQRYRLHRQEAKRRLASAQEHLEHIEDLLREIESQREPLRQEAEVAERYRSVREALREIETNAMVVELAKAVEEIGALEARTAATSRESEQILQEIESLEAAIAEAGERVSEVEREMDVARGLQQAARTAAERAEAAIAVAGQRILGLDELEASLRAESESADERLREAEAAVESAQEALATEQAALAAIEQRLAVDDATSAALAAELSRAEAALEEARAKHREVLRREAERNERARRAAEAERERSGALTSIPPIETALAEAEEACAAASEALAAALAERRERESRAAKRQEREAELARDLRRRRVEQEALTARARGIEATLEAHEGLAQGPRAVLDAVARKQLLDRYVPVAEAISADKAHALAIEVALGGSAHDLIVPHEDDAKVAVDFLKRERAGRATFQPVPLVAARTGEVMRAPRDPDVVGVASDLARVNPEHRPVALSLLGRVLVVRSLDAALRLAKGSSFRRIVTLEGEVVHGSGAVTGGVAARASSSIIQRRSELDETVAGVATLAAEADALERELEALRREDEAEEPPAEDVHALETACREARAWRDDLKQELARAQRDAERLGAELARLAEIQPGEDLEDPDLAPLEAERDRRLAEAASQSEASRHANEALREARERLARAEEALVRAERRRDMGETSEKRRAERLAGLESERQAARSEIAQRESDLEAAKGRDAEAHERLQRATATKAAILEESYRLAEDAKDRERRRHASLDLIRQLEVQRARAEGRRADAQLRLLEEYGIAADEALELAPSVDVPPDAHTLVARLRRELKAFGDVNLGAIEAFRRLSERHGELSAQCEDVRLGKAEIEAGLRELDRITRDRFRSTFEALRVAFQETFAKLFGGGECTLELTDPANLLDTGIDVQVTIPGKRRQRLDLLSGGERALSACAFLFALLKLKPSPLVVLDEVDAPLDGRNVERFIELLREFSGTTQFVIVTHNPVTIESAPMWFGVTMQEPGVSTVVPCRAPDRATALALVEA